MRMEFKAEPPFLEVKLDHFSGDVLQQTIDYIKAFKDLIMAIKEIIEEKLPNIMERADRLQYRVEEVKEHAGHEI